MASEFSVSYEEVVIYLLPRVLYFPEYLFDVFRAVDDYCSIDRCSNDGLIANENKAMLNHVTECNSDSLRID